MAGRVECRLSAAFARAVKGHAVSRDSSFGQEARASRATERSCSSRGACTPRDEGLSSVARSRTLAARVQPPGAGSSLSSQEWTRSTGRLKRRIVDESLLRYLGDNLDARELWPDGRWPRVRPRRGARAARRPGSCSCSLRSPARRPDTPARGAAVRATKGAPQLTHRGQYGSHFLATRPAPAGRAGLGRRRPRRPQAGGTCRVVAGSISAADDAHPRIACGPGAGNALGSAGSRPWMSSRPALRSPPCWPRRDGPCKGSGADCRASADAGVGRVVPARWGRAYWSVKKGAVWWLSNRDRAGTATVVLRVVIGPEFV